MAASETIRVRLSKEDKEILQRRCDAKGISMSEEIRSSLGLMRSKPTAAALLETAFGLADAARCSSGLPSMTDEEAVEYCNRIRRQRALEAMEQIYA